MLLGNRIAVVLPAYNAARTLRQTYAEIPHDIVDNVICTDDPSRDDTPASPGELGIHTIEHEHQPRLRRQPEDLLRRRAGAGADIVVMLHPDYQYTPKLVPAMASMIASGEYDVVLGSRILGKGALNGGMPLYKYIVNRVLTLRREHPDSARSCPSTTQAIARTQPASARSAAARALNSDDFVFDNQMLVQAICVAVPDRRDLLSDPVLPRGLLHQLPPQRGLRFRRVGDRDAVPAAQVGHSAKPDLHAPRPVGQRCEAGALAPGGPMTARELKSAARSHPAWRSAAAAALLVLHGDGNTSVRGSWLPVAERLVDIAAKRRRGRGSRRLPPCS